MHKMLKINRKIISLLYTIQHFAVDGLCAFIIFSTLYKNNEDYGFLIFIIYNSLAFVAQPFVGLFADKINNHKIILIISVLLLIIGLIFKFNFIISMICIGIGNAFFHISGGKYVIEKTDNDIISLGIFVSTGATGLVLGQLFHSNFVLILFLLLIIIPFIVIILSIDEEIISNNERSFNNKKEWLIMILIIILVVFIRSFVGKVAPANFEKSTLIIILIGVASTLGKALGGVVSRFIGTKLTMIISMVLSTILLIFGDKFNVLYIIGIMFFNFSMPITLYYINILLKNKVGFAFGLLAGILFPGYLLGMLYYNELLIKIIIAILNILSILIIVFISNKIDKEKMNGIRNSN